MIDVIADVAIEAVHIARVDVPGIVPLTIVDVVPESAILADDVRTQTKEGGDPAGAADRLVVSLSRCPALRLERDYGILCTCLPHLAPV